MPRSIRDIKVVLPPMQNGNLHGANRPVTAIHSSLRAMATKWVSAYLPGQETEDLEKALATLKRHPELNLAGYSKAKNAHQRVEAELSRRAAL